MAIRAKKVQPSKAEAIATEKKRIESAADYIFTEYRGVTVEQISALRKQLREKKATYHIVKNNFARIAFKDSNLNVKDEIFLGPTAVAYAAGDPNEVAKILVDFAKEVPAIKVKGALVDKDFMDAAQTDVFSKLPGRNTLIAMFMAGLKSPVQKLVYTLVAYQEKLGSGAQAEAAPAAAVEAAAPAAPEAAASAEAPQA